MGDGASGDQVERKPNRRLAAATLHGVVLQKDKPLPGPFPSKGAGETAAPDADFQVGCPASPQPCGLKTRRVDGAKSVELVVKDGRFQLWEGGTAVR